MAPQDDLTAEHRKRLEKAIGDMLETEECLDIFDRAVRQTRQEALREAKEEIASYLEKMGNKIPNSLVHRINMHERLDRLASEGE